MKDPQPEIKFLSPEDLKYSRAFFELSLPRIFPWFIYGVGLLLITAFLWAALGQMEVIIRATVILRPKQNVSELKTAVTGTVSTKNFSNGVKVESGQVLWELDRRTLDTQTIGLYQQKKRTEKLLSDTQTILSFVQTFGNEINDMGSPEAFREREILSTEFRRMTLQAKQALRDWELEQSLPIAARSANNLQDLEAAYTVAQGTADNYRLTQRQKYQDQENTLRSELENLNSQLASLEQQKGTYQVRSPLSGWVEEVKIFNPGDTILAGDLMVRIVPESARDLKAVLSVASNDIAEIKPGLIFRMIFPKLPPSEFGQLEGVLETVPEDAWLQPDAPPIFQLEGSLSRTFMENNHGLKVILKAGMMADGRIIIKAKPIWRFILEKLNFIY